MKTKLLTSLLFILCYGANAQQAITNIKIEGSVNRKSTIPLSLLLNFDAKRLSDYTQLYWKTNNEQNVSYFLVQRSDDGVHFTNIYEQPARSTGDMEHYSAKDNKPINKIAYYRLKSVDKEGFEKLSGVVKIGSDPLSNGFALNKSF